MFLFQIEYKTHSTLCHVSPLLPDGHEGAGGVDIAVAADHLQRVPALLLGDVGLGPVVGNLVLELVLGGGRLGVHGVGGRGGASGVEPVIVQTSQSFSDSLKRT